MNNKQRKKLFAVYSSGRMQTKNLSVHSPPPEAYNVFTDKREAEYYMKFQKRKYKHVKMIEK